MSEILDDRLDFRMAGWPVIWEPTEKLQNNPIPGFAYQWSDRYGELKPIGQGLDVNAILASPAPIGVEI